MAASWANRPKMHLLQALRMGHSHHHHNNNRRRTIIIITIKHPAIYSVFRFSMHPFIYSTFVILYPQKPQLLYKSTYLWSFTLKWPPGRLSGVSRKPLNTKICLAFVPFLPHQFSTLLCAHHVTPHRRARAAAAPQTAQPHPRDTMVTWR